MILTVNHMARMLSTHEVIKFLPELLPFVEQVKAERARISGGGGCSACRERGRLAPIYNQAQQFVIGLPADRIAVLKSMLGVGAGKLLAYVPAKDGVPGLRELA